MSVTGILIREAARLLNCTRQNIHNLIKRGKLAVVGSVRGRTKQYLLVDKAKVRRLRLAGYGCWRGRQRRPRKAKAEGKS